MNNSTDYGLWELVAIESLALICFALIFARPRRRREWISFGVFAAFILAHFTERHGFPLTLFTAWNRSLKSAWD